MTALNACVVAIARARPKSDPRWKCPRHLLAISCALFRQLNKQREPAKHPRRGATVDCITFELKPKTTNFGNIQGEKSTMYNDKITLGERM